MVMPNLHHALDRDAILRALSSFYGITTADGTPTTLFCSALIGSNDFITDKSILLQSGLAIFEDSGATGFVAGTGRITVSPAFSSPVLAGTGFYVLNASSAAAAIVLINLILTRIGDPSAHTLTSLTTKWGDIARSLDLIVGARWDVVGDLGTDIAAIIAYVDLIDDVTNGLVAIKAEVEGLAGAAMRGTDGAALAVSWTDVLATALGNYTATRAAYLDNLIGTVTTGSYNLPNDNAEHDVPGLTFAPANQIIDIELFMNNLAQTNTVREYVSDLVAAPQQIAAKVFPTAFDTGTKCVVLSFVQKNAAYKISLQATIAEGGVKAIPYRIMVRDLS